MVIHVFVFLLLSFLMLCLAWFCHLDVPHLCLPHSRAGAVHLTVHRLLKPRTPRDCPACRLNSTLDARVEPASPPVQPWREVGTAVGGGG